MSGRRRGSSAARITRVQRRLRRISGVTSLSSQGFEDPILQTPSITYFISSIDYAFSALSTSSLINSTVVRDSDTLCVLRFRLPPLLLPSARRPSAEWNSEVSSRHSRVTLLLANKPKTGRLPASSSPSTTPNKNPQQRVHNSDDSLAAYPRPDEEEKQRIPYSFAFD